MGDVIKFERRNDKEDIGTHALEVNIWEFDDGSMNAWASTDQFFVGDIEGKERVADYLERLAWLVRKECSEIGAERGDLLASVDCYESGATKLRIDDDKIKSEAQFKWIEDRLDDAKTVIRGA